MNRISVEKLGRLAASNMSRFGQARYGTVFLSLLILVATAARLNKATFYGEKPYEECVFAFAAVNNSKAVGPDGRPWCERPSLPHIIYRTIGRIAGDRDIRSWLRLTSAVALVGTFFTFNAFCGHFHKSSLDPTLSRSSHHGNSTAFAMTMVPGFLLHGVRGDGECFAVLFCAMAITFLAKYCRDRSTWALLLLAISSVLMAETSCYGVAFAIPLVMTPALLISPRRMSLKSIICQCLLTIAGLCAISVFFVVDSGISRLRLLQNHYWSNATATLGRTAAFDYQWHEILAPWHSDNAIGPLAIGAVVVVVIVATIILKKATAFTLAISFVIVLSTCVISMAGALTHTRVIVPHLLGVQCVLLLCAFLSASNDFFGAAARRVITIGLFVLVVIPCVYEVWTAPNGESELRMVSKVLNSENAEGQLVVFGGTRAYFLLWPLISDDVDRHSLIFCRTERSADNFAGRNLLESRRIISEADVGKLVSRRVIYVQIEAAQSIRMDLSGWRIERCMTYYFPSYTIGSIDVMLLDPSSIPQLGLKSKL